MATKSNYELTKNRMAEAFLAYDSEAIADRWGLKRDGDYLYGTMLDRRYRIGRATGVVEMSDDGSRTAREADHNEAMTIYDLLSHDGAELAGEFVSLRSLAPFQGSAPTLGSGFFDAEARAFDGHREALADACATLGGRPFAKGDVACVLPLFSVFPVGFRFWESDDEFPASIQVLFDRNALAFMHYETLWYAASVVVDRLLALTEARRAESEGERP